MTDDRKAAVRRYLDEAWSKGNFAVVDELISPRYVEHNPNNTFEVGSLDALKQTMAFYRTAFPDLVVAPDEQIAEGERVATRWTATGTQRGPFQGLPATGRRCTVGGITLVRFAGGKIEEAWVQWDAAGLLRQLGAIPAAAPAPEAVAR